MLNLINIYLSQAPQLKPNCGEIFLFVSDVPDQQFSVYFYLSVIFSHINILEIYIKKSYNNCFCPWNITEDHSYAMTERNPTKSKVYKSIFVEVTGRGLFILIRTYDRLRFENIWQNYKIRESSSPDSRQSYQSEHIFLYLDFMIIQAPCLVIFTDLDFALKSSRWRPGPNILICW